MDYVEVVESLREIYSKELTERYEYIAERFFQEYQEWPLFFARAPGRVNIIGEHIDYSGYPVLPMALERDTVMAVGLTTDQKLHLKNCQKTKFPDQILDQDSSLNPDHNWTNYILAGFKSVSSLFPQKKGLKLMVHGDLPQAAGLSSSASITVCSAIATLYAFEGKRKSFKEELPENHPRALDMLADYYIASDRITKTDLAEAVTVQERLVGTACGGMDQAISLLAEPGSASLIEFNPIRLHSVPLPEDCTFLIANSLTPSAKVLTVAFRYNKRVVECRLAIAILCKGRGITPYPKTLKELQMAIGSIDDAIEAVCSEITKDVYKTEELVSLLGPLESIVEDVQSYELVLSQNFEFKPKLRALHCFQEVKRVYLFRETCLQGADPERLGQLMNESHLSCRELYECSSDELDKIVEMAKNAGALGARLTGAGWGGCCVCLVRNEQLPAVMRGLQRFYDENPFITDETVMFQSKPCRGACLLDTTYFHWNDSDE
jgi:N-acetylgalactosamine kinase